MLRTTESITWCNGFRLNGAPAAIEEIEPIFEGRREAALSLWEQYEQGKAALREENLSPEQYQDACRQLADSLGI